MAVVQVVMTASRDGYIDCTLWLRRISSRLRRFSLSRRSPTGRKHSPVSQVNFQIQIWDLSSQSPDSNLVFIREKATHYSGQSLRCYNPLRSHLFPDSNLGFITSNRQIQIWFSPGKGQLTMAVKAWDAVTHFDPICFQIQIWDVSSQSPDSNLVFTREGETRPE